MHIKRAQHMFSWMVIASELSHVFCCLLPTVFTVLAMLVSFGLIGAMPIWIDHVHQVMHDFEVPVISFSAIVLVLGWLSYYIGRRISCHDAHHCEGHQGHSDHGCAKKKENSVRILQIATAVFVINISIFFSLHYHKDVPDMQAHAVHSHDHS